MNPKYLSRGTSDSVSPPGRLAQTLGSFDSLISESRTRTIAIQGFAPASQIGVGGLAPYEHGNGEAVSLMAAAVAGIIKPIMPRKAPRVSAGLRLAPPTAVNSVRTGGVGNEDPPPAPLLQPRIHIRAGRNQKVRYICNLPN